MSELDSQNTVFRLQGSHEDFEGVSYTLLEGPCFYTLSVRHEHQTTSHSSTSSPISTLPNSSLLEPSIRTFDSPENAQRFADALLLAAVHSTPTHISADALRAHVLQSCEDLTPHPRLSRWTWGSPHQHAEPLRAFLHDSPTTAIYSGGTPQWIHPRPSPRDPDEGSLMSCVVQFSGDLDPALGGPEHRYFLFGPGPSHGLREVFALIHQRPYVGSSLHRLMISRDGTHFALLCIDLVQAHGPDTPHIQTLPSLPLVLFVWKGPLGERGDVVCTQLEARTWLDIQREMEVYTQGLRDEGFEVYTDSPDTAWIFTGIDLDEMPPETPQKIPVRRVSSGYWIQSDTQGSTVEDEILNRVWPGVGGQPDTLDTETHDRTFRRGLPSLPVLSLEPSSPLDHPYLPYYDTGLAHLLLQPLDDLAHGAVWTGYVACSLGDPTSLVPET